VGDEITNVPGKGTNAASLIMTVVRRMRQQSTAIVNAVKGEIVRAKDVAAGSVDQVVAVTAYRQFLPAENILFA
jgi:hypothetical protein